MSPLRCCWLLPALALGLRQAAEPDSPGVARGGEEAVVVGAPAVPRPAVEFDAPPEPKVWCGFPQYDEGPTYWDTHYEEDPEPYDWLEDYCDLRGLIEDVLGGDRAVRILHVGCGSSLLPELMHDDCYRDIVSIDTSAVAIRQMIRRNGVSRPGLRWLVQDALHTNFSDGEFDVAIEKSVLDTLACSSEPSAVVAAYLREMARVVRPGGTFLCITLGEPELWVPVFEASPVVAQLSVRTIVTRFATRTPNFAYIVRLRPVATE